jgi:glycosyltransferase involved in cell wall biosynthesis
MRSMIPESAARKLRIGIVTDSLYERIVGGEVCIANGGVGTYIYQLVRHLLEVDQNDELFLIRFGRGDLDIYRHPRVHNIFLPSTRIDRVLASLGRPYGIVAREHRLDLVHFPNLFGGESLSSPIKQVSTLQDLTPLLFPSFHPKYRALATRVLIRRALRRSDRIIVPSRTTASDVVEFHLAPAEKCVRIPHGVSTIFRPIPPDSHYGTARPFILTVGVLEPRKNHLVLLDVLRELHRKGHYLELIIIGRPGWRWNNPLSLPKYHDLQPWVRILTDVSDCDLPEFYNRAELFIYPSFYEGFGLPILEAMACGTPVIASSTSSMPEVGGTAALFADPHSPREFATQALRILESEGLRQRLSQAGIHRAQQFTWQATARATSGVYRAVCDLPS